MKLAAIADDITGATDLASVVRQAGLSVVQTIGVPDRVPTDVDALVVSLKIRTAPVAEATSAASAAAAALRNAGASQIYFKYCSTFDSTDRGNIGPIAERLLDDLGAPFTVATPAYPELQRTVYLGHLFVGGHLLGESPMRDHPLTPMRDSNLVRVLGRQCQSQVGLVPLPVVDAGAAPTRDAFDALQASGRRVAIVDAVLPRHLDTLAEACTGLPLVTGAAGLARGLARRAAGAGAIDVPHQPAPCAGSRVAILSGSCSAATQAQVAHVAHTIPSRALDIAALAADSGEIEHVIDWATDHARRGPLLIYSTAAATQVQDVQRHVGPDAGTLVESAFTRIAVGLADAGVRTFIVAGGETSGAVLEALNIRSLAFGDEIDPGVPWTFSLDPPEYRFALKSGNFGSHDFFTKAMGKTR
jgi:uncharacterized protein YgbK (DUF1537 family)